MNKRLFLILCLEGSVLSFNVAAAAALVPQISQEFALSQFLVGKIIWLYMLPYGLAALLYGPLIRRFDCRRVELVCMFIFSLANFLAGLSVSVGMLFAARFLMGFFGASVIPLGLILIGQRVEKEKRGTYIGIFFGSTFVASLAGLALSAVLNWRLIFLIPAVLGLFLWAFMYLYLPNFKQGLGRLHFGYLQAFKEKKVIRIFSYIFLISLIYHAVQQWLGVYFSSELLLGQFNISLMITLTSLSGIFGEFWGGRMADRLNRQGVVSLGIAAMAAAIFLLLLRLPLFFTGLTMIIWGLGWTFNHVGLATMLTDLPDRFLNEAASLNSAVRFISGGLGALFGGFLMQKSFSLGFIISGSGLLLILFFNRVFKFKLAED